MNPQALGRSPGVRALGFQFGLWSTEERYQLKEIETVYRFLSDEGPAGRVYIFRS